jgi:hypothetical protein
VHLRSALVVLGVLSIGACGGSKGSSPTSPTPVGTTPSSTATLSSIAVSGPLTLMETESGQFRAMARYSDNSERDVSSEAAWASSAPPFATVNSSGVVSAVAPGDPQINATFQGRTGFTVVKVTARPGTPWAELPALSAAGRAFITESNLQKVFAGGPAGTVKRWMDLPIAVYADPGFRREDVQDAVEFWARETDGKVKFAIVSSAAEAKVVFGFDDAPVPAGSCGVEGPEPNSVVNSVITRGYGWYRRSCNNGVPPGRIGLAHGLGHVLGLLGHTASASDLMGSPQSDWNSSPLLREVINWLYSVAPGRKPQRFEFGFSRGSMELACPDCTGP